MQIVLLPEAVSGSVTVTRTESRIEETAASVVALDRSALDVTAAATLDDRLRQVPGFSLFRRAGSRTANPTTQGVSLRGIGASGASRALVLADGASLNDPFGGWVTGDAFRPNRSRRSKSCEARRLIYMAALLLAVRLRSQPCVRGTRHSRISKRHTAHSRLHSCRDSPRVEFQNGSVHSPANFFEPTDLFRSKNRNAAPSIRKRMSRDGCSHRLWRVRSARPGACSARRSSFTKPEKMGRRCRPMIRTCGI